MPADLWRSMIVLTWLSPVMLVAWPAPWSWIAAGGILGLAAGWLVCASLR